MVKAALSFLTGGSAVWYIVGALALACAGSGWLLWGQIERNGALKVERDAARAAAESTRLEMRKQAEIYEAGDRAVVALTEYRDVVVQTRVVTVLREIERAPDADVPARAAVRLGWQRMHDLDDIERRSQAPGAAGPAAAGAVPAGAASGRNADRR